MAYVAATVMTGETGIPRVNIPNGILAGDIVILAATVDYGPATFQTADWPTGFTELSERDVTLDEQTSAIGWKRATGPESGYYQFGSLGTDVSNWVCLAAVFRGRHSTNPPTVGVTSNNNANASPATVTSPTATAIAGDDLLHVVSLDTTEQPSSIDATDPTNFTLAVADSYGYSTMGLWYRQNVSAGATGVTSNSVTFAPGQTGWLGWKVRIPVAGIGCRQCRAIDGPFSGPLRGSVR